ncbi:hypothetical protein [Romeriopsis navalis]|nr:hypothetical protein [Romeriopsis navalis]
MNQETQVKKLIYMSLSLSISLGVYLWAGLSPGLAQAKPNATETAQAKSGTTDKNATVTTNQKPLVIAPDPILPEKASTQPTAIQPTATRTTAIQMPTPESTLSVPVSANQSPQPLLSPRANASDTPKIKQTGQAQPTAAPSKIQPASEGAKPDVTAPKTAIPPTPLEPQAESSTEITEAPVLPSVVTAVPGKSLRLPLTASIDKTKIGVFIDQTDITSQIQIENGQIVYTPKLLPMPLGSQTAVIYQINSPQDWQEVQRFKINVVAIASAPNQIAGKATDTESTASKTDTPTTNQPNTDKPEIAKSATASSESTESAATPEISETTESAPSTKAADLTITPTLNINVKSQFSEFRTPDAGTSERPSFNDATFTAGLEAQYEKGTIKIGTKVNLLGVTFQPEALRFGDLQNAAPQLDLSDYVIDLAAGPASLSVGHVCYGNNPLLISSVCTRGLTAKIKLNDTIDFSLGRISSTGVVGFDNIVGLERDENALTAATLGLQLLKNDSGGVRLETSWMNGQRSPVSNFNVGEVVDAEKSNGFGLRLTAADASGRLKADAGFARSTFTNPSQNDPQLSEGIDIVEVVPATRNAWYTEASYDLIQGLKLDENRDISLSFNFRKERADPQFGTLGAGVTADALQTTYGFNATIAGASLQFQENTSEDNLANLVNLLKTRSRNTSLNISAPLQTILQVNSPLLPTLTYGWQRSKQKGSIIEALEGGFDNESEIPEQVNVTQQAGVSWNIDNLSLNYQYSNAFQDNRQLGRENADFRNISNQFSVGLQASPTLNFTLGYGITQVNDLEQSVSRFSHAPTFGMSWEFVKDLTFALNFNRNDDTDSIGETFSRSEGLEMLLTWKFNVKTLGRELPGSFFVRYGRQTSLSQNLLFGENTDSTIHTVNGGFSFSF